MTAKSPSTKKPAEQVVKDIRRATRRHFSAADKIRIVLDGLRGEDSIAELCRKEGIAQSLYYTWSKEFMEAGKRRLAGDTEAPRHCRGTGRLHPGQPDEPCQGCAVSSSDPRQDRALAPDPEPTRVCRRLVGLSYAAMTDASIMA